MNKLNCLEDKNTQMKEIVDNTAVKMWAAAPKYSTLKIEKTKADKKVVKLEKELKEQKAKKLAA